MIPRSHIGHGWSYYLTQKKKKGGGAAKLHREPALGWNRRAERGVKKDMEKAERTPLSMSGFASGIQNSTQGGNSSEREVDHIQFHLREEGRVNPVF